MAWTDEEMNTAKLIHGPDSVNSDTYRLWIEKTDYADGKMLNVPGWMVGDQKGAELRMRAAAVIRRRLAEQYGVAISQGEQN